MMQQSMELNNVKMSQEHLNVLALIRDNPNGIITRKEIVANLGESTSYYRKLNTIINELVTIFNEPIGSSSTALRNGYFYCREDKDFYIAEKSLKSRVESINERANVIRRLRTEKWK